MDELKLRFEKWFDEHMYIGSKCIADPATKRRMFCAWVAAWKASREAIEIKLPTENELHQKVCSGCASESLEMVEQAIRTAGIKVKE